MKASLLFLAPFVLAVSIFFVGCGEPSEPLSLSFGCNSQITLKMGTLESAQGNAPLVTNYPENVQISYDSEVIEYDVSTGIITPKKAGNTVLLAEAEGKVATVNVIVEQAVYTSEITLAESYRVKLNGDESIAITPSVSDEYNMGFEFISQSPNSFTVDDNGVITPLQEGSGLLKVVAKSGCEGEVYGSIWDTATIIVEDIVTDYNIRILDNNYQPLEQVESEGEYPYYELFSGDENTRPQYILEITSNVSMKNSFSTISFIDGESGTTTTDQIIEFDQTSYDILSNDGKTLYRPFYAVGFGLDYFSSSLLDVALNYENLVTSNTVKIKVYEPCTEIEVAVSSNQFENESSLILGVSPGECAELTIAVDMGENTTSRFSIEYDANNISANIVDNQIFVSTSNSGIFSITIKADDILGVEKTVTFEVRQINFDSPYFVMLESDFVELKVGSYTSIDYALKYDVPDKFYCVVMDKEGNKVGNDVFYISIEMNIYIEAYKSG